MLIVSYGEIEKDKSIIIVPPAEWRLMLHFLDGLMELSHFSDVTTGS